MTDEPNTILEKTELEKKKQFHAQLDSKLLKTLIKIAELVTITARLSISPNGIELSAINPARSTIVKLNVNKKAFEEYKATNFDLGLDLIRVKRIVDIAKINESIDIKFDQKQNQILLAVDELKIRMPIMDLQDVANPNPMLLNEHGHAIFKVDKFKRGLILSEDISESVILGIDSNKFELRTEQNVDSVEFRLGKQDLVELESRVYFENMFPSKILKNLVQQLSDESSIEIRFGDQTPLQIDYNFSYDGSHMKFFLVPMISEA